MLEALFWLAVGILVGWNIPRPEWAKNLQDNIVNWFKRQFGSDNTLGD